MPDESDHVTVRSFSDPGQSWPAAEASRLPELLAAGTLDLEDEYLLDPPNGTWLALWKRPGISLPAHWRDLVRLCRAEMDDRRERVRQRTWTREQYLHWRAEQLALVAGGGMPTLVAPPPGVAAFQDDGWPDEAIPSHVREEYECVRPIGHGGSGSVYLVRRRDTHAESALKITKPGIGRDAVINELRSLERVRSPFVVGVRNYREMANGRWLIFTEYVPGMTLQAFRQSQPKGRIADRVMLEGLLMGIARGLADLHQHGLVHRDLKPANIILREGPGGAVTPVIIDLGMARGAQPPGTTVSGGTPGYLSPEQIEGRPCTPASDVFAFGLIAYELVVGSLVHGFQHEALHEVCTALPKPLDALIKHGCANRLVERRIADGTELVGRLAEIFGSPSLHSSSTAAGTGRRATVRAERNPIPTSAPPSRDPDGLDARALIGDTQAILEQAHRLDAARATPTNLRAATLWYEKAARAGHAEAMVDLGWRLLRGIGTPAKPREGVKWIRQSAEAGNAGAMADLAWCLLNGVGIDRNPESVVQWYGRAADRGNLDGMTGLAWCLATGTGVRKDPPSAVGWYRRAADRGALGAMYDLGCCLLHGIGTRADPVEGIAWLRRAAEGGLRTAMAALGWCFESGTGTQQNSREAAHWYERAAIAGDAAAMNDFGACLVHAIGVARDPAAAAHWFRQAAEAGDPDAMHNLAQCLASGSGTARNRRAAERWLRRARSTSRHWTQAPVLRNGDGPVDESVRP